MLEGERATLSRIRAWWGAFQTINVCGRNASYPAPPAQIRTRRVTAYGSYLEYLASKRSLGCGCIILAFISIGSQISFADFIKAFPVHPAFFAASVQRYGASAYIVPF